MHEYGIIKGLLSLVDEHVQAHSGRRAVRVVLGVTGVSGPEEHLLRDAFEVFRTGTSADAAELVLERAPSYACCLGCGHVSAPDTGRCPSCGSATFRPSQAPDICLKSVEIEV